MLQSMGSQRVRQLNNNKIQENKRGSFMVLFFNEAKIIFKGNTVLNFFVFYLFFFILLEYR